jgi:threonine dehydrogenase-like Zn-dependent dehydrogenase
MNAAPQTVRSAVVSDAGHFAIESLPVPEPGPDAVRVRVEACGICGSDLHFYNAGLFRKGHTPGHEIAGRIEALGADVAGLEIGEPVAVEPIQSCGHCAQCLAGQDSICRDARLLGVHQPGGLSDRILVPADRVYRLAPELDPAVAALTEPLAVSVHGLERGRFEKGQRVLVLGAGAVGLVTLVAAQSLGAREVLVTARYAHQAERARALGANRVLDERDTDLASLDRLGRETDIDLVVETVGGRADTLRSALAASRPGAHVSVLGLFMEPPQLDPLPLLQKELTLCWSNCYHRPPGRPADFETAAAIVDAERDRLSPLVTHRLPLERTGEAFRAAADKRAGAVKVSVLPDQSRAGAE